MTKLFALLLMIAIVWTISVLPGCTPNAPNDLDKLNTVDITIKDQKFRLWVADDLDKQARGLMFVTADQMKPLPDGIERGMIFVFPSERHLSFWMRNTIIPLDIAYLDRNGVVVSTYTMAPLDDRNGQYPSRRPAKYAIEVNADRFRTLGLEPGDQIEIPDSLR
jgi:uncharacterized protein